MQITNPMRKKIAVIGGGISGMAAAYLLAPHHEMTLYEAAPKLGGHSRTLNIDYDGTPIAVDTGFIVYNERNYPLLTALFKHLKVQTLASDMSFAASLDDGKEEWSGDLFAHPSTLLTPARWPKIRAILKFNTMANRLLASQSDMSLGDFVAQLKLGKWLEEAYILPMAAAIWSCPASQMRAFPAKSFLQFFHNHGLLTVLKQPRWRTVQGGSQQYVQKLQAATQASFKLATPVQAIVRQAELVRVITADDHANYDQIIFACHGDTVLNILGQSASKDEKRALGAFSYQNNIAYLHRDMAQMPRNKNCWSSWNYLANRQAGDEPLALTYWMNRLQQLDRGKPLFVTLNPVKPIAADKIFDVHHFTHPVFTAEAVAAQSTIQSLQGKDRIWFCGAHLGYGFHEDGLRSAVQVAQALGATLPW